VFEHDLYWRLDWHQSLPFVVFVGQTAFGSDDDAKEVQAKKDKEDSSEKQLQDSEFEKLEKEFTFKNTFGEQLEEVHSTKAFLYNYQTQELFGLDLSEHETLQKLDLTVLIFKQDPERIDLFLQGYSRKPFRSGFVHCFNRESHIFSVSVELPSTKEEEGVKEADSKDNKSKKIELLKVSKSKCLTKNLYSSYDPFLHPSNNKLFFVSQSEKFVEHNTHFELFAVDVSNDSYPRVKVLDTIKKPNSFFVGLNYYIFFPSKRYFLHEGKFLVFSSQIQNFTQLFIIKTDFDISENFKSNLLIYEIIKL
jgi:hypothetical protein